MRCVYVAGKYRDESPWLVEQNIRKAEADALTIWKMGAVAVCPHSMTRFFSGAAPDEVWLDGMLELLRRCDAVYMCQGWEQSRGSVAEGDEAVRRGIPVFLTLGKLEQWLNGHSSSDL